MSIHIFNVGLSCESHVLVRAFLPAANRIQNKYLSPFGHPSSMSPKNRALLAKQVTKKDFLYCIMYSLPISFNNLTFPENMIMICLFISTVSPTCRGATFILGFLVGCNKISHQAFPAKLSPTVSCYISIDIPKL